ncbi:putative metalloprotease CJM1_0395 family protein [Thalassotalea euphylliae]|uniref:putative metalloprotease CJM1_0395 family protein n=1 Tax=Thalassotalea euphylliae TaxID=1655234 RepID=UPI00363E4EDE
MNIVTQVNNLPLATVVNPSTDNLRRDNVQREVITQPAATNPSAAEKGVAGERERARTPNQNVEEGIDFAALQEQAEQENNTVNERQSRGQGDEANSSEDQQAQSEDDGSDEAQKAREEQIAANDRAEVKELRARDIEVRAHELAHASVGGPYTGSPVYEYETGPDGNRYAVGGSVSVDLSLEGSPEETISKMRQVYRAALAPAEPSPQDRKVAASAKNAIADAQAQLARQVEPVEGEEPPVQASNNLSNVQRSAFGQVSSGETLSSAEFDQAIEATIAAQEQIAPSRDLEIDRRAEVIESAYSEITQAYERPPRYQFELQA